jgi:hypothetical protein
MVRRHVNVAVHERLHACSMASKLDQLLVCTQPGFTFCVRDPQSTGESDRIL